MEEKKRKLTEKEVLKALQSIDWEKFWAEVSRKAAQEIEGYHEAQRNYLKHPRVFLAAAQRGETLFFVLYRKSEDIVLKCVRRRRAWIFRRRGLGRPPQERLNRTF